MASPGSPADAEVGRALFELGRRADGTPLMATWSSGISLSGSAAACATCHRRSGQGGLEGGNLVPPVHGSALFSPGSAGTGPRPRRNPGVKSQDFHFRSRPAYAEHSLARVLAEGITPGGAKLSGLMPRYTLTERELGDLVAHLSRLSATPSPGVEGNLVHFATVHTPDALESDRTTVSTVLRACFEERYPLQRRNGLRWTLHEWSLTGQAETWQHQLRDFEARQPVFALVSGSAGNEWQPVHQFCTGREVPCLFPNVAVPASPEPDHFNFYFSAGPLLEAAVMRRWLADSGATAAGRLVQLRMEANGASAAGAKAFAIAAQEAGHRTETLLLQQEPNHASMVLEAMQPGDTLVLWLNDKEMATLTSRVSRPPEGVRVIASGALLDRSTWVPPAAWRSSLLLTYPFDPPRRRRLRMQFNLQPWLDRHGITDVQQTVAGNTLATCNLLTEAMASMQGTRTRQKLVEQIENYPWSMGNAPATQAFQPFSLATGQRFGAKGAYIVRYGNGDSPELEAVSGLIVP